MATERGIAVAETAGGRTPTALRGYRSTMANASTAEKRTAGAPLSSDSCFVLRLRGGVGVNRTTLTFEGVAPDEVTGELLVALLGVREEQGLAVAEVSIERRSRVTDEE